jgi:hypothetical protein
MSKVAARGESSRPPVSLSKQKGWIGFVRDYRKYIETGNYDDIKWDKKSKAKKVEEKKNGRTIYTF